MMIKIYKKRWGFLIAAIVGLICYMFPFPASANAPAPSNYAWFTFDTAPDGVQLVHCESQKCEKPQLLKQSGVCNDVGCLPIPSKPVDIRRFDCVNKTCLYADEYTGTQKIYLKLIAQVSGRLAVSAPINGKDDYGQKYNVNVQNNSLIVERDNTSSPTRLDLFWKGLGLTQVSEIIVAAVYLVWRKAPKDEMLKILCGIVFVNLLTFPVVWLFFPAWQPFQHAFNRTLGVISLLIAIAYSIPLTRNKSTLISIIKLFFTWLISLPLIAVLSFIPVLVTSYNQYLPITSGITSIVTLLASEVFAFTWEAWLINRINRETISIQKAILLSILINTVSLVLGLLLLPTVANVSYSI